MTLAQLEKRVKQLEKVVSEQLVSPTARNAKWWLGRAGAFANDPGYEEMVRLGRKYRQSSVPKTRKAAR